MRNLKAAGDTGSSGIREVAKIHPDRDSRDLFANLMKDSERGDVVGAVVITLHRRKPKTKLYTLHLAGHAVTNPTFALGATRAVAGILADRARKDAGLAE